MGNKLTPVIRFKGFTEDWEQRKLGDIVTKAIDNRGKTPPTSEVEEFPLLEVASIGGYYPDYSKVTKYVSLDTYQNWFRAHLKENDILFSTVGNTGLATLMDTKYRATVAQNIVGFRSKKDDPQFLLQMFKNHQNLKKAKRIEMGAVQPSIKVSQLINVEYFLSRSIKEQSKIGNFFKQLDDTIALQERKLELLKIQKKGYLQKMFPKQNEKVPELRFKGFNDTWEQRKLGEYTDLITKGTTPKDKRNKGIVTFVKVENLSNGQINSDSKISLEEHEGYLKRSRLEEFDILFSIAGTLGRTASVDKSILPANTNQALAIIRGYKFDKDFLLTSLNGRVVSDYIRRNPTIGAQPNLSLEQVGNLVIWTPSEQEQQKIGAFFKSLDDTITLQERKLESMKEMKKGFLQKLFV